MNVQHKQSKFFGGLGTKGYSLGLLLPPHVNASLAGTHAFGRVA